MWRLWKGIYPECGGIYAEIDSVRGLCAYDVIYDMRIPCICVDVQGSVRIRESAAVFLVDLGVQIMPVLFQSDVLEKILGYMPFSSVREMSQVDIDWSHAGISLAVAAAYGAVMIVATWLTFRKRDLR